VPKPEHWLDAPEDHDYPAAADYLSLTFTEAEASAIVDRLRTAELTWRKAKDLLRASRLDLLGKDDPEVIKDLKRVGQGEKLSPVLLVRTGGGAVLVVADGYHRICASYHLDEDAPIACRLVDAQ
jgi:hypothetical protein